MIIGNYSVEATNVTYYLFTENMKTAWAFNINKRVFILNGIKQNKNIYIYAFVANYP